MFGLASEVCNDQVLGHPKLIKHLPLESYKEPSWRCYNNRVKKPNTDKIKHDYAGVFLITESGKVIGQKRDNKPTIDYPDKVGIFGGAVEEGESPLDAAWRELTQEETNIKMDKKDIKHLLDDIAWRELTKEWEVRHFYYAYIKNEALDKLEVYEGQGWAYISGPNEPDLIESGQPVTKQLFDKLGLASGS